MFVKIVLIKQRENINVVEVKSVKSDKVLISILLRVL